MSEDGDRNAQNTIEEKTTVYVVSREATGHTHVDSPYKIHVALSASQSSCTEVNV